MKSTIVKTYYASKSSGAKLLAMFNVEVIENNSR